MFEILAILLFIWLLGKTIGLAFRLTWGAAKIAVTILMALALPLLIGGVLLAGGLLLVVPLGLIGIAFGIVKACVS